MNNNFLKTPIKDNFNVLSFKAEGISIPNKEQQITTIFHHGQSIPKVIGKVNLVNKGSLTIPVDQEFSLYIDINNLSGIHNYIKKQVNSKDILNYDYIKTLKNSNIDIIVETPTSNDIREYTVSPDRSSLKNTTRFTFHECKFLGNSNSFDFNSSNVEELKVNIPFTFRYISKSK